MNESSNDPPLPPRSIAYIEIRGPFGHFVGKFNIELIESDSSLGTALGSGEPLVRVKFSDFVVGRVTHIRGLVTSIQEFSDAGVRATLMGVLRKPKLIPRYIYVHPGLLYFLSDEFD